MIDEIERKNSQILDLSKKETLLQYLQEQLDAKSQQLDTKQTSIITLNIKIDENQKLIKELNEETKKKSSEIESLTQQLFQQNTQFSEVNKQLEQKSESLGLIKNDLEKKEIEIQELNEARKNLITQHNSQIQGFPQSNQPLLKCQIKEQSNFITKPNLKVQGIATNESQIQELQQELEEKLKEIESLNLKLQELSQREKTKEQLQTLLDDKDNKIKQFKDILEQNDIEYHTLQNEYNALLSKSQCYKQNQNNKTNESEQFSEPNQMNDLPCESPQIRDLQLELNQLKMKLAESIVKFNDLKQKHQNLQLALHNSIAQWNQSLSISQAQTKENQVLWQYELEYFNENIQPQLKILSQLKNCVINLYKSFNYKVNSDGNVSVQELTNFIDQLKPKNQKEIVPILVQELQRQKSFYAIIEKWRWSKKVSEKLRTDLHKNFYQDKPSFNEFQELIQAQIEILLKREAAINQKESYTKSLSIQYYMINCLEVQLKFYESLNNLSMLKEIITKYKCNLEKWPIQNVDNYDEFLKELKQNE